MDPKARVRSIIIMASTSMEEGILFSSYSIFQLISMELQFLIIV